MKQNKKTLQIIGVTGGIGAGKSEVLAYIEKHYNCRIYLADQVAHMVKEVGGEAYQPLVDLLGEDVLEIDGTIHKSKMADKIFANHALLEQVNQIVHPAVKRFIQSVIEDAQAKQDIELLFVEAALLIEAGYESMVDELWYIYAQVETRTKRLMSNRGYSMEKVQSIMEKQLTDEKFREHCDFVIDNSGELAATYAQIDNKLEGYTWLE